MYSVDSFAFKINLNKRMERVKRNCAHLISDALKVSQHFAVIIRRRQVANFGRRSKIL